MRCAIGSVCANSAAPPITHSSASPATNASAASMLLTASTPWGSVPAAWVSTRFRRPGSGLPIESKVRRPISSGLPSVTDLKCCRSSGRCQGNSPPRPITPLSAIATTSTMLAGTRRSQLHLRRQHDHALLGHAKEFYRLRAAPLHPRKQPAAYALIAAPRPRCDQVPAEKERAVLPEQLQSAHAALLECLADIGCLHETETRRDRVDLRHQHRDPDAISRILARRAQNLHV